MFRRKTDQVEDMSACYGSPDYSSPTSSLPRNPSGQFSPNVRKSNSLGKLSNGTSTLSSPRINRTFSLSSPRIFRTPSLSSPRINRNRAHGGLNNTSNSLCRLIERMVILSLGATILFMSRQSKKHYVVTNEELTSSQRTQEKLTLEIARWQHQNKLLEDEKEEILSKRAKVEQLNNVLNKENNFNIDIKKINSDLKQKNEVLNRENRDNVNIVKINIDLKQRNEDLNRENRANVDIKKINSDLKQKFAEKEIAMEDMESAYTANQKLMVKVQHREEAFLKNVDILKHKIMLESYRDAFERFGAGPHYVKFWVELPPQENGSQQIQLHDGKYSEFTIKLYPLDAMPHSVHLFLEQVHHNLWDGCKFLINAFHITQTGSTAEQTKQFSKYNLDKVFFQEYNKDYPHKQWSVGFAGRPGGPDFYINKIDNTKAHGPHGQGHWDLPEEADPCFGEIVDGLDVVMRFNDIKNTENDEQLAVPINIAKAWIVRQDAPLEIAT